MHLSMALDVSRCPPYYSHINYLAVSIYKLAGQSGLCKKKKQFSLPIKTIINYHQWPDIRASAGLLGAVSLLSVSHSPDIRALPRMSGPSPASRVYLGGGVVLARR